jgi:ACS family tartrate transporter-like MFS transporter
VLAPPESTPCAASALRKITLRLIPFLFLLYIVAWLDRVNVGFAALQMNSELQFSAAVFGFGSGVFFLGYCLFEVPSNIILDRVGARLWIARIMVSWGVISVAMMFVRTSVTFYLLRFLLGVAEAGFFPGIIYYLSGWYPRAQRARAIAAFMTAVPVTGLIGGPLSGALLGLNGVHQLAGWQWLFLCEGLPAIILGATVPFYLIDKPEQATWLSAGEREWLVTELARERTTCIDRHSGVLLAALTNGTIWRLGVIFLLTAMGFYGYSFWAPLVIKSLTNSSNLMVGLILAAISAGTIVCMQLNSAPALSRRSQNVDCAWAGETGIFASPCPDYLRLKHFSFFPSSPSSSLFPPRLRVSRNTAHGDLTWRARTQKPSQATISSVMPMEAGSTKLRSRRTSRPILCAWP